MSTSARAGTAYRCRDCPGTEPPGSELNTLTWDDWYGEVTRAFDQLCLDHDAVVVCGLSMGGTLVLRVAADHPDRVAGVVVVNPVIATKRWDVKLLPVLKHVVPSLAAIGNDMKKPGGNEHAYDRTPLKALHSLMRAWPPLIEDLPKITAPLLYFRALEDHVVDNTSQPIITSRVSSSEITERSLLESYHVATLDNDAEQIFEESAEFISKVTA